MHAFSGCDTTSALFYQGKMKFIKVLRKKPYLNEVIEVFKNPNADPEVIAKAGERFIVELYSYSDVKNRKSTSLNNYRYACFTASAYKRKFNIASLPPTEAAARQHSFRTYHQIQQWYGNEHNVEQWGWKKDKNGLIPVTTVEPPAPDSLLKLISCKCKKGCHKACGCRKAGLKCSVVCTNCGGSCDNSQFPSQDSSEDEETDTILEQINDEIENEEDRDETDDPIADDAEETSVFDIPISGEDDENTTPGPSTRMKRRRLNYILK